MTWILKSVLKQSPQSAIVNKVGVARESSIVKTPIVGTQAVSFMEIKLPYYDGSNVWNWGLPLLCYRIILLSLPGVTVVTHCKSTPCNNTKNVLNRVAHSKTGQLGKKKEYSSVFWKRDLILCKRLSWCPKWSCPCKKKLTQVRSSYEPLRNCSSIRICRTVGLIDYLRMPCVLGLLYPPKMCLSIGLYVCQPQSDWVLSS